MGNMEQHLGNITSTTLLHQARDWNSPRGTVIRIQALALVAIALSFFLAFFGSCRRWSNRWIVQKGFLAAQVLSLSLGTYSIGLMQSSWVKSEMYPIWAVSLVTLFGCVDPLTTYNGLDYKGPILKVIFQLCLYCGYVLLMSISTIKSPVGNLAIGALTATTFFKGLHRSLALVLQMKSRNRSELGRNFYAEPASLALVEPFTFEVFDAYKGQFKMYRYLANGISDGDEAIIEDALIGYCLANTLRWRFLGMDRDWEMAEKREQLERLVREGRVINYKRTLKAIEAELVFLYDVFFTSNEFRHFYEARPSRFWALASFGWICFVGAATAVSGTLTSSLSTGPGARRVVVNTTTADRAITLVILGSLALLQLVELIRCWTSNWGRVMFACNKFDTRDHGIVLPSVSSIRMNWFDKCLWKLIRMNWFDKYRWQDKLGQHSLLALTSRRNKCCNCDFVVREMKRVIDCICFRCGCVPVRLSRILGLRYIGQVLWELCGSDIMGGAGVRLDDDRLDDDVKASITDFLGQKIKNRRIGDEWYSLFDANGIDASDLPYNNAPLLHSAGDGNYSDAYAFAYRAMVWHIATWYCERQEQQQQGSAGGGRAGDDREKNRHVATALSRYCAYLVASAPELLPGSSAETARAFDDAVEETNRAVTSMSPEDIDSNSSGVAFETGVYWGKRLRNEVSPPPECAAGSCSADPWEVLALLWVQTLLYAAAPYGDLQAHMQHLSQGGEFITHLCALLYHIGINKWEHAAAPAAAQETEQEGATGVEAAGDTRLTTRRLRRASSFPSGLGSTLSSS